MMPLRHISDFIRRVKIERRFGELSRSPLKLLRLQIQGERAEVEWLARTSDEWDAHLPWRVREEAFSLQALQDAIALREMVFDLLPDVHEAEFRAFRQSACEPPRMVIFGRVTREAPDVLRVASAAMRAKLYGLHFQMQEGVLRPFEMEESSLQVMVSA